MKRRPAPRNLKRGGGWEAREAKPEGPDSIEVIAALLILGEAGMVSVIGATRGCYGLGNKQNKLAARLQSPQYKAIRGGCLSTPQ